MTRGEKFFYEVVLPSTGLPKKPSYNLAELATLLGYSRKRLYSLLSSGDLKLRTVTAGRTCRRRVYLQDIIVYFDSILVE